MRPKWKQLKSNWQFLLAEIWTVIAWYLGDDAIVTNMSRGPRKLSNPALYSSDLFEWLWLGLCGAIALIFIPRWLWKVDKRESLDERGTLAQEKPTEAARQAARAMQIRACAGLSPKQAASNNTSHEQLTQKGN